jgi:hypothetical protein
MTTHNGGNIVTLDATATAWTGVRMVKEIQWVNDAGDDVADASTCVIASEGSGDINVACQDVSQAGLTAWRAGPFDPPLPMKNVVVTLSHGLVIFFIQ